MKFTKTFCAPSSTVTIIPAGLPVKLQYNEHGVLQKLSVGFSIDLDPQYSDISESEYQYSDLFNVVKRIVPANISTTGGTTWIFGLFYSDNIPCDEGMLPQILYKSYINDIIANSIKYKFYAGYITSLAAVFNGPLVMRNFLGSARFDLLPQLIVPVTMTDETLQATITSKSYPFHPKFILGFFIFENLHCRYSSMGLLQLSVTKNVTPFIDADGYIKGEVLTASGRTYVFGYSTILHHKVTKDSVLLTERDGANSGLNILATRTAKGRDRVIDNTLQEVKCPVCGKKLFLGNDDSPVQCDDPHCLSHLYNDAVKMMSALGLPSMSYNSYKALVDARKIICLTDLLELPPCKDVEIKTSLANALYSVVPVSVVPNIEIFERFANKCNNSIETAMYYIQNPLRLQTDLDIVDPIINKFIKWLEDPFNVASISAVFERIKVDTKVQKFDGCPIFRGVTIALTGKFKRGNILEIESILRSYAANVVTSIEPGEKLPDVVIMGSLNDGISGQLIQKAKIHNIPIQQEDDFFARYEIDKDLQANLL